MRLGTQNLIIKIVPDRDIIIPFDQRRPRSCLFDHILIKLPDRVSDGRAVAVDQNGITVAVQILIVAAKVNFPNFVER